MRRPDTDRPARGGRLRRRGGCGGGLRAALPTLLLLATAAPVPPAGAGEPAAWPSFRGPGASGVAEGHALPVRWDVPSGEGALWSTEIPGLAHASPIVWGERLFVLTAVAAGGDGELRTGLYGDIASVPDEGEHAWRLVALDRGSGAILWDRVVHRGVPASKRHPKATHANSTPATDGERVVVLLGSEGLHAYDLAGEHLWSRDLGRLDAGFFRVPEAQWGFGSSPVIHDGKVVVQADVQGESFLALFDAATGRELWRTPRDDVPTWSTPTVHAGAERTRVLVNGYRQAGGYDFATGELLWHLHGSGDIPVPTPVVAHGLVFLTHAHGGAGTWAVRLDARGDLTPDGAAGESDAVAWREPRNAAYMQTPIVYGDILYVCRDNGVLTAYEATTGEVHYTERLEPGTGMTASPVAGDGKLYFTAEDGTVFVVAAGPELEVLAESELGEATLATPAIAGGVLYFRTRGGVVAIDGVVSRSGSGAAGGEGAERRPVASGG